MSRLFLYEADDDANGGATAGNDNAANTNTGSDTAGGDAKDVDLGSFKDDDFTIGDADNAPDNTDDNNADDSTATTGDDTANGTDDGAALGGQDAAQTVDPESLKAKDRKLFDSLSIEEQKIKVKELKKLFGELYSNCDNIANRFNSIAIDIDEVAPQIRRALNIIFDLKNMISFYILNIYDQKSYIENDIAFNRYLSVLNSVKNVIKDIKNMEKDDNMR